MLFAELLTGIILIICGFLVKEFPDLIAGYNTLTKEQKKKVDIDGLSLYMKNYLISIGCLVIIVGCILYSLNIKTSIKLLTTSAITVIGIIIMIIKAQKF